MDTMVVDAPATFYTDPYDGSILKSDVLFETAVSPIMFERGSKYDIPCGYIRDIRENNKEKVMRQRGRQQKA